MNHGKDYIVDEVRRIREEQAAEYGFDIKTILAAAKKRQHRSRLKVVSFAARNGRLTTKACTRQPQKARLRVMSES